MLNHGMVFLVRSKVDAIVENSVSQLHSIAHNLLLKL